MDDLPPEEEVTTPLTRLRDRTGRVLAIVLAALLVVPAGAWLVDAVVFRRDGSDVAEAVPALADAVALVTRLGCDGGASTGSGFAVTYDGGPALVTNRHVAEGAASIGVRTLRGAAGPEVTEVLLSPDEDVAVLRLSRPLGGTLAIGNDPSPGDGVQLVGFPGARPITTAGVVTEVGSDRVALSFDVGGGASGAPVVNDDGTVVAQVVARRPDGTGVAITARAVSAAIRSVATAPDC